MIDELRYIEQEAREQGEADFLREIQAIGYIAYTTLHPEVLDILPDHIKMDMWEADARARGVCLESGGVDFAETCPACNGTGKDLRGCEWCGITHHIQRCPAIAFYGREGK